MEHVLWYQAPAENLHQSLPLGNGRLGAMLFGGAVSETIQIDESTFWSGCASMDDDKEGGPALRAKILDALKARDFEKADALGRDFVGNKNNYGTNLPVGILRLTLPDADQDAREYRRELDISRAVCSACFELGGARHVREAFVSNPAGVFALRHSANGARFDLSLAFEGIQNNLSARALADGLLIEADAFESRHSDGQTGTHLNGRVRVASDGRVTGGEVTGATFVEVYADMATTMSEADPLRRCEERLDAAVRKGFAALRSEHIADHRALYDRMEFELTGEAPDLPTDARIRRVKQGGEDLPLCALLFHYGRYLMIASSRGDSPLPTHMGGVWNDNIYAREDCAQDMHIDMNIQMQYWIAGPTGLFEAPKALFRWLKETVLPKGRVSARKTYGADGFCAHVVSNAWGYAALGWAYNWGMWALGGLWVATLLWDHYRYTRDDAFLRETAYPVLIEAARFASDYLFEDAESGYLLTGPAYSPENWYGIDGARYCVSMGNTCDILMIREIFSIALEAAPLAGENDRAFLEKIRAQRDKLPPYQVGKYGQIQEWLFDFDEAQPGHRHTSHLLGLYPFRQILPGRDEALCEAAKITLQRRYDHCELTSWTMAFFISYYARLKDGERAYELLRDTFKRTVADNLSSTMGEDLPMWGDTWELDGNTGLTSAMCEMLVQTVPGGELLLLPALPAAWKDGFVRGIRAENGIALDIRWRNGALEEVRIRSVCEAQVSVKWGGHEHTLALSAANAYVAGSGLDFVPQ